MRFKLERNLYEAADGIAAHEGVPVGHVLARLIAQALGEAVPDYCQPQGARSEQLALDQERAA
ncbi:hypothetical protein CFN78_28155 [Amycolatopsis antarctica]|uniref:CopG family transcriptional regulator n=1 Tax=Amycolatopsis antarctica TaxID=1854586 RepID=A0A263CV91_9PSEU|nr:hypothetical protein [Amycolatopsis antarctica]OZM69899.1 hypothetical protein CFN78_28155 [Amycolatopsis antarctica]